MGTFHLFTLARGAARLGFARVHSVHLVLQGETGTGLTLVLPTCDPEELDPEFFEGWLATIQGPAVTAAADDDDDQRAFLLRVVLTYRAFATQDPSLTIDKYHEFTSMFVVSSLALDSDDDAGPDLAVIDDWMTENIPLAILEPRDLPPRSDVMQHFPGHRIVSTDGWTSSNYDGTLLGETIHILTHQAISRALRAAHAAHAPVTSTTAGASSTGSRSAAPGTPASTAHTHNGDIATANADHSDAESDGSMPGLKTPSDGSDGE